MTISTELQIAQRRRSHMTQLASVAKS
jgi:hypothetical protein